MWRLFFSKATPTWAKVIFGAAALIYIALPFDFIPEFMLPVGLLDDLVIAPLLIWLATRFASKSGGGDGSSQTKQGKADKQKRKVVPNESLRSGDQADARDNDVPPISERADGMRRKI